MARVRYHVFLPPQSDVKVSTPAMTEVHIKVSLPNSVHAPTMKSVPKPMDIVNNAWVKAATHISTSQKQSNVPSSKQLGHQKYLIPSYVPSRPLTKTPSPISTAYGKRANTMIKLLLDFFGSEKKWKCLKNSVVC